MNSRRTLLALAAALLLAPLAHAKTCDVHSFGAKGDGTTPDTAAIQKAIDTCSAPDSTIELTAGTYLSAPLTLRTHTHLKIDTGATLLGSKNKDDYPQRTEPGNTWRRVALLHADDADDVSITGGGTIDGQGQEWWNWAQEGRTKGDTSGNSPDRTRPLLIDLVKTNHILIDGVTIQNSPMYNITLFQANYITITNIKILNPQHSHNTDGIDPFFSSHIKIDHVYIDTGDDCIAIKSGLVERGEPNLPSFDITVTNSEMLHGHGLSIGSEIAGGVHDVTVQNVKFKGTDAGIRVKSNRTRGNDVYNLDYSNIAMEDVKVPILITEYYPKIPDSDVAQPMAEHTPRFRDITISNLAAIGAQTAMQIAGLPESPIRNLKLTNVSISAVKPAIIMYADIIEKNVAIKANTTPAIITRAGVNIKQVK
ncbi:MAG TPA: glycosyl hydrolase family 28 protein [Acidobacteriaceae bacterium]